MPNPLVAAKAFLDGDAGNQPADTTRSTGFPASAIEAPHIQFAWDGTPTDADNREDAVIRITVWAPRRTAGDVTTVSAVEAQDIAGALRARILAWSSADVFRVDRGAGRLPGIDKATGLPFCSFTVSFVMHALTP